MDSVIKGAGYILAHVPDMAVHDGTTQTTERAVNPDSEYLKEILRHLRSYEDACFYLPNQVYIGNAHPDELRNTEFPWHDKKKEGAGRFGKFGEIMPQEEFFALLQAVDAFEVVKLEKDFAAKYKERLECDPAIPKELSARIREGVSAEEINGLIENGRAEGLYLGGEPVGCVKPAHDIDVNLSAHVMLENLASKATSVLAILYAVKNAGIEKSEVGYVIDCAEEACGDMNQRGGGNLAKAAAEAAGLVSATGSDTRAFCAAPVHACIEAASLVKAGVYKTVVVTAGGCAAKLGMNGKEHVKKGLPVLEDCLGGFAVVISENDNVNPQIDLNLLGRHSVGTGSAPQAVIGSLVADPLYRAGMKITDIDKYSPEMQNPEITKNAGAGDVPLSNYKMIGALAVKRGELQRKELAEFTAEHGLVGWAPTQGHIPSGVPYIGFAREDILSGKIKNAMIIGKGSLFLGRMTNLFDGVSFVMHKNTVREQEAPAPGSATNPRIAVTGLNSELGEEEVLEGAKAAAKDGADVYYIGTMQAQGVTAVPASGPEEGHRLMEALLSEGKADAAVTMHYTFPIGVSTVGRSVTPAKGRQMYIATTTGTAAGDRVQAMVLNAIYGIIAAKACGDVSPAVGILNVDGARQAEIALKKLKANGYPLTFAQSRRSDGGCILRGNDVLSGSADVLVCDSLSGNILSKMLSSFTTGGSYESTGFGYGPGIGKNYGRLVMIVSRASGAPVIEGAIKYAAQLVRGKVFDVASKEFAAAEKAGLYGLLEQRRHGAKAACTGGTELADGLIKDADGTAKEQAGLFETGSGGHPEKVKKEVVTAEIPGIEITDLDEAAELLQGLRIYAESGMGCTGPVILVSESNRERARQALIKAGFIGDE